MKKICLYTKNNDIIQTMKTSHVFKIDVNTPVPKGDICMIDCTTSLDMVQNIFHPCIAIVNDSRYQVPFEFDYVVQEPFEFNNMIRIIRLLLSDAAGSEYMIDIVTSERIADIFRQIGMDEKRVGFKYLQDAVELYIESGGKLKYNEIFRKIAQQHSTTSDAVERAIRTAIEKACQCGDMSEMYKLFGNSIHPEKGKPSNAEFIAMIAEHYKIIYHE